MGDKDIVKDLNKIILPKLETLIKQHSKRANSTKFPRKSLYWAKKKAKQIVDPKGNLKYKAKAVYDNMRIEYGFEESLNTGNFAPWPHEVKKEAECLTYLGCAYLTAKELGLNPRLFNVFGVRDSLSVKDKDKLPMEHAFMDVDVRAKRRLIIDIQMSMIGYASHDKKKRIIRVDDNYYTGPTVRHYDNLIELTPEQYVKKIQFLRTPHGSMKILEEGQKIDRYEIGKYFSCNLFIKYFPENEELEAHVDLDIPLSANRLFVYKSRFDDKGKSLDERIKFAAYRESCWLQYKDRVDIGTYNLGTINQLWDIFKTVLVTKDSNASRHGNIGDNKLIDYLVSKGIGDDFSIRDKHTLEKIVDIDTVERSFDAMNDEIERQYAEISCQDDELFNYIIKSLAMYNKAKEKVIAAGEDYDGFVFTREERTKYVHEHIEMWEKLDNTSRESYFQFLKATADGKKTGSYYIKKSRMNSRKSNKKKRQTHKLYYLSIYHRKRYDMIADKQLFAKKNKEGSLPEHISALEEPDESEKYSAYKRIVFEYCVNSYQMRNELTLKEYKKCLESKFKDYKAYNYIEQNLGKFEEKFGKRGAGLFRGLLDISGELYVNKGNSLLYDAAEALKIIINS